MVSKTVQQEIKIYGTQKKKKKKRKEASNITPQSLNDSEVNKKIYHFQLISIRNSILIRNKTNLHYNSECKLYFIS